MELPEIQRLRELPEYERAEALEDLVVTEFKATVLMPADEELPMTESFFEMGFTSLRLTEVKQRLELLLGCEISTNALFNQPTVAALLGFLREGPLSGLFPAAPASAAPPGDGAAAEPANPSLVDFVLEELYGVTRAD